MAIFMDNAPSVGITVIVVTILAYTTFGLRVYTRLTRRNWGLEDWTMTVATVPFAILSISCLLASLNGVGIHAYRLEEPENVKYTQLGLFWFFLFEVFYCVAIIPIKASISFMLIRIAEARRGYIYTQYVIIAMCTTMNLIAGFYIIFQCNPVSAAWDSQLIAEGDHCNDAKILADIYYATTAVNIFTDWFTALMPIPLIWGIKLNRNAKISVAAILGLGIFASLSACIRLKYTINLTNSDEYLYGLADIVLWGYAENGIGMLVGNIATLRPLLNNLLRLGGSDAGTAPTSHVTPSSGLRNIYHRYQSFDTHELNSLGAAEVGNAIPKNRIGDIRTEVLGGGDRRDSFSSDGGSQKQIIEKDAVVALSDAPTSPNLSGGIVVSR
ncbi:hypothetical protein BX600DRAFT_517143 [Xylariales sp. PMI_506]|nr:hypothetical protein BX600DRAFT_517143 [Xylariales sp. PMI_506]